MKVVKLKGGLGNQMFQYAFAKLLEKKTGDIIRLDYTSFQSLHKDTVRVPRIEKFSLSLLSATEEEINENCVLRHKGNSQSFFYRVGIFLENKLNRNYFLEPDRAYVLPEKIMSNNYFDGYWQSWRYVKEVADELKVDFKPNYILNRKSIMMQDSLQKQNSVFVGVRRGDYSKEKNHYGEFDLDYYKRAMLYIADRVSNPVFYFFSNDIDWCVTNIKFKEFNICIRESEQQFDDFEELMVMRACKHAIIGNSTYHWWGATLINNSKKIVCCPEKWWFDDKPIDIIPGNWIKIKNRIQ